MNNFDGRVEYRLRMLRFMLTGRLSPSLALFSLLPGPWKRKFPAALGRFYLATLREEVAGPDQYHLKEYVKPGSIFIDAGANVGVTAVFAESLGAKVYAFEPCAETFKILRKNESPNLICVNEGLGNVVATKQFVNFGRCGGGENMMQESKCYEGSGTVEQVAVTTLDEFVRENQIPKVDFIKIDTEGYEAQILQGAKETIKRDKPTIAMVAYHKPEDKELLPATVKDACPDYVCDLSFRVEEVFICHV